MHHDTVFAGLFDFGYDDGAFLAVRGVEASKLRKGVIADYVGV